MATTEHDIEANGAKRNGPIYHLFAAFFCFFLWESLSADDIRPNTKPWPSDWFAASFVLLGAFLSGVHTLPGERLNGMAFSVVGALVGGIMVSQVDFRWWVGRGDFASELVVCSIAAGAILVRLAGMAGKALNNPFGHPPD